jgi:hypothetical protein
MVGGVATQNMARARRNSRRRESALECTYVTITLRSNGADARCSSAV